MQQGVKNESIHKKDVKVWGCRNQQKIARYDSKPKNRARFQKK